MGAVLGAGGRGGVTQAGGGLSRTGRVGQILSQSSSQKPETWPMQAHTSDRSRPPVFFITLLL